MRESIPGRRFDLVIFDCDGVLVDSERIANREFASLLKEIGLDFTLPQDVRDICWQYDGAVRGDYYGAVGATHRRRICWTGITR